MNLSSKSILVVDGGGLFVSFARRMTQPGGFGKVWYSNMWHRGRPTFSELSVGKGYDGIEVVPNRDTDNEFPTSLWSVIDKADVIAFPDCYDGDWQEYLRKQGKHVWGSGMGAELELNRFLAKQVMDEVGLPVGPYCIVKGMTELREYLRENADQVLKVSFLRGLMETRKHHKYWLSKTFLDGLEYRLGPLAEDQEFIVEQQIPTEIEVGGDHTFVHRFPSLAINGVERKDAAYLGIVQDYDELPDEIRDLDEKIAPVLERNGYANFFSSEVRKAKNGKAYPIDLTCRCGSPSGEAQLAAWDNMPEVVWAGAHGEFLEPEPVKPCVAQLMIFNKGEESEWAGIEVPAELDNAVNLYFGMRRGREQYVVPQQNPFDEMGSITMLGDTPEEAVELCKKASDKLQGNISVQTDELDNALKEFDLMRKKRMNVEPAAV